MFCCSTQIMPEPGRCYFRTPDVCVSRIFDFLDPLTLSRATRTNRQFKRCITWMYPTDIDVANTQPRSVSHPLAVHKHHLLSRACKEPTVRVITDLKNGLPSFLRYVINLNPLCSLVTPTTCAEVDAEGRMCLSQKNDRDVWITTYFEQPLTLQQRGEKHFAVNRNGCTVMGTTETPHFLICNASGSMQSSEHRLDGIEDIAFLDNKTLVCVDINNGIWRYGIGFGLLPTEPLQLQKGHKLWMHVHAGDAYFLILNAHQKSSLTLWPYANQKKDCQAARKKSKDLIPSYVFLAAIDGITLAVCHRGPRGTTLLSAINLCTLTSVVTLDIPSVKEQYKLLSVADRSIYLTTETGVTTKYTIHTRGSQPLALLPPSKK